MVQAAAGLLALLGVMALATDVTRLYILGNAEGTADVDWRNDGVESTRAHLERFYNFAREVLADKSVDESAEKTLIDRWMLYSKAKTESLQYIPLVTKLLKENKLQEAIDQAKRYKNSHIAKVVSAALMEFKVDTESDLHYDVIEAARRSIERVSLRTATEMKTGLGVLATIGASGPFVGLFGTVLGIIHAFAGMAMSGSGGIGSVAGGIAEALWTTALGLGIAIPAVWMFNKFSQDTDKYQVEMSNSSSELVDYFIKHNPAK